MLEDKDNVITDSLGFGTAGCVGTLCLNIDVGVTLSHAEGRCHQAFHGGLYEVRSQEGSGRCSSSV